MTRQKMIAALVDATIAELLADPERAGLQQLLEHGCSGFARMSDAALGRELQLRGVLGFDEPEPFDFDFDDDDDEDDDEIVELLARTARPDDETSLRR
ncbi:MAG: hypothetical protein IT457_13905 [Planctomycetes bacterium]|nr:hypothetical protein [Planctomycetota bacterium]